MILLPRTDWEIRNTKHKGRGVFVKQDVPKGTIVAEYVGEIISILEVDIRKYGEYLMAYDDTSCIIPDLNKTGAHLINHSCEPNCWIVNEGKHIYFKAIRDIKSYEELTIDYLYPPLSLGCTNCSHICKCGSKKCRGTMHSI